jgi:predicted AlkP superfamily pyrophosphatase or phosphodiesterase
MKIVNESNPLAIRSLVMRVRPLGILLACVSGLFAATVSAQEVKHVVLISVDGLAASYVDDPKAELPTLRMLAKRGARADGMITTFPSVTWPSHTSLITGCTAARHGVIGNSVFDRRAGREVVYIGDPELEKADAIKVPTLYDIVHAAGLKSGSVIWPCCNGARSLDWVIPDSNKPAIHDKYTTPGFVAELKDAGIDITELGKWGWNKQFSSPRDDLYTRVALHLLEKRRANLVLLHLITPDGIEHAYGPHTPEAYKAVAEADANVKRIWDALQKPPFAGQSALFVTSDHGFAGIEKLIRPNVELKRLGLIETNDKNQPTRRQAWCVAQGGSAFIYLLGDGANRAAAARVRTALSQLEGVDRVLEPGDFAELGLPLPMDNPQAPDFILTTGQGYSFNAELTGEVIGPVTETYRGTHGHLPQPAYMHATFIAAGTGIRPGTRLKLINNIDVAPTIARLMGLKLDGVDGRVLDDILTK